MNLKEKIKSLLQQGKLYRSQGLATEAIGKYKEAIGLIENAGQIKNKDTLIAGIQDKIQATATELEQFEQASDTPEVSEKIQDLIQKQFAFSDDADKGALEGAIALAKFGQFNRALVEFEKLIEREKIRVDAAKNIIRCHMALSSLEEAVEKYHGWLQHESFKPNQLNRVRVFFEATLEREGIDAELPEAAALPQESTESAQAAELGEPTIEMADIELIPADGPTSDVADIQMPEEDEEEILDINSIGFTFESGPSKGSMKELNVSFQSGDVISILIPGRDREIIEYLEPGLELANAQFYSPIAIFNGNGKVVSKMKIESGPRRGDYNVDIKVITA